MACRKFLPRTRIGRVGFVCGLKRGGVVGQVLWKSRLFPTKNKKKFLIVNLLFLTAVVSK